MFSLIAAFRISGVDPKNFIPSAPFIALSLTQFTASSTVFISDPIPKPVYVKIRGAIIEFFSLFFFKSKLKSKEYPLSIANDCDLPLYLQFNKINYSKWFAN